jgi:protease II
VAVRLLSRVCRCLTHFDTRRIMVEHLSKDGSFIVKQHVAIDKVVSTKTPMSHLIDSSRQSTPSYDLAVAPRVKSAESALREQVRLIDYRSQVEAPDSESYCSLVTFIRKSRNKYDCPIHLLKQRYMNESFSTNVFLIGYGVVQRLVRAPL